MNTQLEPDSKGPVTTVLVSNKLVHLEMEEFNGVVSLHMPRIVWSKDLYKSYLVMFEEVKATIRALGYDRVLLGMLPEEVKSKKLIKMFGFEEAARDENYEVYLLWLQP